MKKEEIIEVLSEVSLFRSMTADCILLNLNKMNYFVKTYDKNEVIAREGDDCNQIGIVLSGNLELRKEFPAGHYMTLTYLDRGHIFGEVIVFSNISKYPATIITTLKTEVLYIHREDIIQLMEGCESILKNFVSVISNKVVMLNKKTSILSFKTIEEKVASYILEEYKARRQMTFNIPLSRKELAGYLNVPRPSLSRTMGKMKTDGVIDFYQNTIKILDIQALEDCLFKI